MFLRVLLLFSVVSLGRLAVAQNHGAASTSKNSSDSRPRLSSHEQFFEVGSWRIGSSMLRVFRTPEVAASFVDQTIESGLRCFDKLNTADSKENAKKMRALRASGSVKLFCGQGLTADHGGQADYQSKTIFMSDSRLAGFQSEDPNKARDARALVFHEFIHLLGHEHGEYEYAYTCEACCFPQSTDTSLVRQNACSLCAGEGKKLSEGQYLDKLMTLSENYRVDSPVALTLRNKLIAEGSAGNLASVKRLYDVIVDSTNIPKSLAYGDVFSQNFESPSFRNPDYEKYRDQEIMTGTFYSYYKGLADIEVTYLQGDYLGAALKMQKFARIDLPTGLPSEDITPGNAAALSRMFPLMRDDVRFSAFDLGARIEEKLKKMGAVQKAEEIHKIFYK
jgi:hypothetical protein